MNKELEANTTLSHYRIVSKIGAGGMGEVYLAQDTKLDRRVALKILPAAVASNRDRMERFVREAKSAASLNHPNIAHVYEIGESDGTHYIAMEFIDGETLRHKIHKDKAPLPKLLKYLTQVAQGLSKAHAAGIVHRDLKPDNIMITRDDYAKVLDFGLAKLVEPQRTFGSNESGSSEIATAVMQQLGLPVGQSSWDSGHSTPGMVIGTIGYMSPEQASGRVDEIDLRSDIFSFGCILFEAATGQRAFAGKDVLDSLHKIVHAPTPQLKDANPLAPAELQRVVRRCLAKEPEKRYQSIKELAIELDDLQQELKGFTKSEYSGHPTPATSVSTSGMTRGDEGFWIAVLPFKVRDADPAVAVLADGLSEEIVTGLSRFRYLSVVTSTSAVRLKGETEDERALGAKLGTRYVLEGSIRKGGSVIRVSAQLVDTETGAQLWSETYNRDLQTFTIFAVQDDVAGRIVATVADSYGVLVHSMRAAIRKKDDADLTPVEWQFQYFAYREQITPSAHAALKSRLERVAKRNDRQSDLWACLAQIYVDEYAFGFEGDATSLDRALAAGRRAVELDRANQFALVALAQVHFFRRDLAAFGPAAERGMALNPLNTDALGILGLQIVHTGEFERGTAIVRRAMELNANHAGWMHFAPLWDHFHKGEYERALECANRVDVPGLFWPFLVMASACGHLGRRSEAEAAVRDLLALDPEFAVHVRSNVGSWHFASGLMDPILEGLRKAGLEIDKVSETPDNVRVDASTALQSLESRPAIAVLPFDNLSRDPEQERKAGLGEEQETRALLEDSSKIPFVASTDVDTSESKDDEVEFIGHSPSIAVLPFVNISNERENEYFCDGLAEELLNALSKIESLHVAARTSAFYFKGKRADISEIGSRLNVSTVLEGSVRKSGNRVRISVQLVNVADGYHLWSEKYDRKLKDIFDIQDEISLSIVDALKLKLLGTEQSIVKRYTDNTEAYQLYLKGRFFVNQRTSASLLKSIDYFNQAITLDSNYPLGYAGLADAYLVLGVPDAVTEALSPRDSLSKARAAAEKALQIDTSVGEIYTTLAHIKWKERDWVGAENDYRRSIELNPHNPIAHFYHAVCLAGLGRCDDAVKEIRCAQELDPLSLPVNASVVYVLYLCRRYDEAIEAGKKTLDLDAAFPLTHQRLGLPYIQKKMYREAIAEFEQAVNNSHRAPQPLMSLGHAYAVSGNKVEAKKVLAELKDLSQGRYVSPYGVAAIYVGLGEKERAFDWLEKAFDEGNTELTFLKVDPRLDPLRDDPRLQELLDRAGFPQ